MGLEESKLETHDLHYLLRHTSFSCEEILEMYKTFIKAFPRGTVTKEEFKSDFGKTFPKGDASDYAKHIFRALDANGDGVIDFREYLSAMHVTSRGRIDEKINLAFTLYDIDGNKEISIAELEEVLKSVHKAMGIKEILRKRISQIFRKLDANGDGRIVPNEFMEGVKRDPNILSQLRSDPMFMH